MRKLILGLLLSVSTYAGPVVGTTPDAIKALAAITPSADNFAYWTGAASASNTPLSAFSRSFLDDADAATHRTTIGLGVVENTALSTWAGTTNITTLGTIVTGTWNASDIGATYLPGDFSGFANPSASLGLTANNGSATTAMRSDASPALDVGIIPTWTGTHTFNNAISAIGGMAVGDGTSNPGVTFNGPSGVVQDLIFKVGGNNRWVIRRGGQTESGSNVGSDFQINARDDAGADLGAVITIRREAGGLMTITRDVSITDATASSSVTTGALIVAGGVGISGTTYGAASNWSGAVTIGAGGSLSLGYMSDTKIPYINGGVVTSTSNLTYTLGTTTFATANGTFSGTLGAVGNFSVNTNKFNVTASSGNTFVAGTLGLNASPNRTGYQFHTTGSQYVENSGAAFDLVYTSTGQDAIFIRNTQAVAGLDVVHASIGFGRLDGSNQYRGAAIAAIQTSSDADQTGLNFYVQGSTASDSNIVRAMQIKHDKAITMDGALNVTGLQTNSNSIVFGANGSGGTYSITRSAAEGLYVRGGAGSTSDFALISVAGNVIFQNPTGTNNLDVGRTGATVTFPGTSTFTGLTTHNGGITSSGQIIGTSGSGGPSATALLSKSTTPAIGWNETDAASNTKHWDTYVSAGVWHFRTVNDANSSARDIMSVTRDAGTYTYNAVTLLNATDNPSLTTLGTGRITLGGGLKPNGASSLGATEVHFLNYEHPVTRYYIGDGTGYSLAFSQRTGSVTTDWLSLSDVGVWTILIRDNNAGAFNISQGSSSYLNVSTLDGAEIMSFGSTARNPAYTFLGTGTTTLGGSLLGSATAGSHAFASSLPTTTWFYVAPTSFTSGASGGSIGRFDGTINAFAGGEAGVFRTAGTIVEAGSGAHALLWGTRFVNPTVTGAAGTVTKTATVYIDDAMTATVTDANYALYSNSGANYFGGSVKYNSSIFAGSGGRTTGAAGGTSGSPTNVSVTGKNRVVLTPTADGQYYNLTNPTDGQIVFITNTTSYWSFFSDGAGGHLFIINADGVDVAGYNSPGNTTVIYDTTLGKWERVGGSGANF